MEEVATGVVECHRYLLVMRYARAVPWTPHSSTAVPFLVFLVKCLISAFLRYDFTPQWQILIVERDCKLRYNAHIEHSCSIRKTLL